MDARAYLERLARRDDDEEIRRRLERRLRPRWNDRSEWRISTETEESIRRRDDSWEVRSTCDFAFVARVGDVDEALTARSLFYSLHPELFYALGWPTWAGLGQLEPSESVTQEPSPDADPYLKQLFELSVRRYARLESEIEATIDTEGEWIDRLDGSMRRIAIEETYPERPAEATEPIVPELWFPCAVEHGAVHMSWRSPTVARGLLFVGILEQLVRDIESTFGWR